MVLWFITFLFFTFSFEKLSEQVQKIYFQIKIYFGDEQKLLELKKAISQLKLIEEVLLTGNVPEPKMWNKLKSFPSPWNLVVYKSISELRDQGASILPTLSRMGVTLQDQFEFILEGKSKSSQSMGQSVMGLILIPAFGTALYFLLPGLEDHYRSFIVLFLFSFSLSLCGFFWMLSLIENARYGRLLVDDRRWLVSVHAVIERILSQISIGMPPDLAWKNAIHEIQTSEPELIQVWGVQVWEKDNYKSICELNACRRLILSIGLEIRKSIQTSLLEGRPCIDRIEVLQKSFQLELRSLILKELNALPNVCLKPLFLCLLPGILIILFGSLALSLQGMIN